MIQFFGTLFAHFHISTMVPDRAFFTLPVALSTVTTCNRGLTAQQTFFACTFCFPNTDHVLILSRFGPFFCSLKRAHADIFMLACALFNKQNKEPILLSIMT